jgi:hypothetical protein
MIHFEIIGTIFTVNLLLFLKVVLSVLLIITAVLFIYCRRGRIVSFLTGKPYDEKSENEMRERRLCDRRIFKRKKGDRRKGERRSSGVNTA